MRGLAELNQMTSEVMSVKVVVAGEENSLKGNSGVHRVILMAVEGQAWSSSCRWNQVRTRALISS